MSARGAELVHRGLHRAADALERRLDSGRILGGLVLLFAALRPQGVPGLIPMAAADLGFGIAHAAFWLPIRS